jgi:glyoxylase-like metal-dependent hydrolase (beta-lactamase superfamily II)
VRLLVDPGIATWEIEEAAGDGAQHILITHADWDHVMGIGLLPDARVWACDGSAERIRSGEAKTAVEQETRPYGVPYADLDGLRVDELVPVDGSEYAIGPWRAHSHPVPGHVPDGIATWLPDEDLLVVGDYLSPHEIPFIYDSAWAYRDTLDRLTALIGEHRPALVVIGHGSPHVPDRALAIAAEDRAYVQAVIDFAEGGGDPAAHAGIAHPHRGGPDDATAHRENVERACARHGA